MFPADASRGPEPNGCQKGFRRWTRWPAWHANLTDGAIMARLQDTLSPKRYTPRTPGEFKACAHVRKVFGADPASVRTLSKSTGSQDVCVVTVGGFRGRNLEFICAGGLLVGIAPKKPR